MNLVGSRTLIVACLGIVCAAILVAIGKATSDVFLAALGTGTTIYAAKKKE